MNIAKSKQLIIDKQKEIPELNCPTCKRPYENAEMSAKIFNETRKTILQNLKKGINEAEEIVKNRISSYQNLEKDIQACKNSLATYRKTAL